MDKELDERRSEAALYGKTVLVVDDEPLIRTLLKNSLNQFSCTVFEADNARVAINLFKRQDVDIIISDVRMPNGDGSYLLKHIGDQCKKKGTILVMMSGQSFLTQQELDRYGAKFMHKPFSIKNVSTIVEECGKDKVPEKHS